MTIRRGNSIIAGCAFSGGETSWDNVTGDNKPYIYYDTSNNYDYVEGDLYVDGSLYCDDGINTDSIYSLNSDKISVSGDCEFTGDAIFSDDVDFSNATITGLPGQTFYYKDGDTEIMAWKLPDGYWYCEQSGINQIAMGIYLSIPYTDNTYNIQLTSPTHVNAEDIGVTACGVHYQNYDSFEIAYNGETSPDGRGVYWKTSGYVDSSYFE